MANLLNKLQKKIMDFFIEEDIPEKDALDYEDMSDTDLLNDTEIFNSENMDDDTDTASLDDIVSDFRPLKKKLEDDIVDSDYWWCLEETPPKTKVHSLLKNIDDSKIYNELNRRIDNDEFPVIEIPDNIMKTMGLLNNPEFDYSEVAGLINHSPAMAGEFIKVINSSLYSRGLVINDLKLALPRMGKENIKALLYMYSTKMSFAGDPLLNKLAEDIVDHSYSVAIISSYLSQRYYPDPDGAFLAGLLHDIGKLGILKSISETYKLPRKVDFEMTLDVFDNILPPLHEKAGKFLAENWKVNKIVIAAIEHHHDFMDYGFTEDEQLQYHLSALVNLSDAMARILGHGQKIGPVNIFSLPATIDLSISRDHETIGFLENIPEVAAFKSNNSTM